MDASDKPSKTSEGGEGRPPDLEVIRGRLEEILSKPNLGEDSFIQQHMNAQLCVPASILIAHRRLSSLEGGVDVPSLVAAARKSTKLGVDEDGVMIRPLLKPRRNTLILHDLPEGIPEEELREVFAGSPEADSLSSLRPDVNRTAYATFKTEDAATTVALWLRSQKLRGAEIKCAVKAEHFVRSFYPVAPADQVPFAQCQRGYTPWGQPMHQGCPSAEDKGKGKMQPGVPPSPEQAPHLDFGSEEEEQKGYLHDFQRYSRQQIVDCCSGMAEILQPDSYRKLLKDNRDIGLFRQIPCREWAPPPTPGLAPRSGDDHGDGHGRPRRKSSSLSRRTRSTSGYSEDFEGWHKAPRDDATRAWDVPPPQRGWMEKAIV